MKPKWCTLHSILLRIKGLYMFRAITCSSSGFAARTALGILPACYVSRLCHHCGELQSWHSQLTLHARNIPSAVCGAPPEDEQVTLETCKGPWFSINWMKSASRWFHYTDILWCTVSKTLSLHNSCLPKQLVVRLIMKFLLRNQNFQFRLHKSPPVGSCRANWMRFTLLYPTSLISGCSVAGRRGRDVYLLQDIWTGFVSHPASCIMETWSLVSWDKAAVAWNQPFDLSSFDVLNDWSYHLYPCAAAYHAQGQLFSPLLQDKFYFD
jgi:hypothetical protein